MRRELVTFILAALGGSLLALACGAQNLEAPAAEAQSQVRVCKRFDELMPDLVSAIDRGETANIKQVVEAQLLKPIHPGGQPPISDVMAAVFGTLTGYASLPPEAGAPSGELCAPNASPPPLVSDAGKVQVNPLCELRRAIDLLVHQGIGVAAINLLQPQLTVILNYLTGTGTSCNTPHVPRTAHYEIAGLLSNLCSQDANCQLTTGLDLVIGVAAYVQIPAGKKLVDDLYTLAAKTSITDLLDPQSLTENDAVAIVKGLIPAFQSADSAGLKAAFNALPLPPQVHADLAPVVDDLTQVLDNPAVIGPVRKSLTCITTKDPNYDVVRMIYQVAIAEQCPDFGLTRLTAALQNIQTVDQRRSVAFVLGTLASSVRQDETAIDSAALVCKTMLSTAKGTGQPLANAQLVLPEATRLVENGLVNQAICTVDTLLFGCVEPDGGLQPACH
jgi:hypothetical protein